MAMGKKWGAGSGVRRGRLGDAMEAAEVQLVEEVAKIARQPADYHLFRIMGTEAVKLASGMSTAQRSQFLVMLAERMPFIAHECRQGNNRLQHALDLIAAPTPAERAK